MHDSKPKPAVDTPLDVIETPVGDVSSGAVPTLSETLDAYRPPSDDELDAEPLDPEVRQRVYLLAAVLGGVSLAVVIGSLVALALSLRG